MIVFRVFSGDDGESHFEDVEVALDDRGGSSLWPASAMQFRVIEGQFNYDFHTAIRREVVVTLEGVVKLEVGSGEQRVIAPGSVVILDDLTGRGHKTLKVDDGPSAWMITHLSPDVD